MKWETCRIDFLNAFVQAKLKQLVWVHLPCSFQAESKDQTCLRLKQLQYGLSCAPALWSKHILNALHELGLRLCQHNQCLFFMKDLLLVLYVNDAGITAPNQQIIDEFVQSLQSKGFELM